MIPLVTAEQVKEAEQRAIRDGRSESALMLEAGTSIANAIEWSWFGPTGVVTVLCGPGNNGGDGLVVADQLARSGWTVAVWAYSRNGAGNAPVEQDFDDRVTWIEKTDELEAALRGSVLVVDAVFGASSRAELPDDVRAVFDLVRSTRHERGLTIWAIDVPSGLSVDTGEIADGALAADVTAMIGLPKIGAFRMPAASYTGRLVSIDIGLSAPDIADAATPRLLTAEDARGAFVQRRAGAHKRSVGTVLVVGGAPNYFGAPRLTAEAALRSGAGLVQVAAPASIISTIAAAVPELTYVPLPAGEHTTAGDRMASLVRDQLEHVNALVIGPGLGTDPPVPDFLGRLFAFGASSRRSIGFGLSPEEAEVERFSGNAVLDADALNWLATQDEWWTRLADAELILTPHPGELARLLGVEVDDILHDPWERTRDAASKFGQVVVLKHAHSVVATPDGRLILAPQAPPSLATAGSGDVLSGVIGSFLAQGMTAESAACAGVIVGLAATELAEQEIGIVGLVASDVIQQLPRALTEISGINR